ncbi:MAG: MFS transporter [bacterium]|nr:MFS transporter [bacterium]
MEEKKSALPNFPKSYWISIFYEFVERGAYYGVMSILSVYLVTSAEHGGLGFSKMEAGTIKATIQPILYALPIFCGALADRFGYRKTLMAAFLLLGSGYILSGHMTSYPMFFLSMVIVAIGAGTFKPVISGTIARVTDENSSTLGFGIFYWSINLGSFLASIALVPVIRNMVGDNYGHYIFAAAGIMMLLMLIPNIFLYKEPPKPENAKSIPVILAEAAGVLTDYKFIILLVLYSGFWILYFQMFDTVLWYITEYANIKPVENAITAILPVFTPEKPFKLNPEYFTAINAGTIILLQFAVSAITRKTKALPTMITGIMFGIAGMAFIAFTAMSIQNEAASLGIKTADLMKSGSMIPQIHTHAWALITGVMLFTLGEMTAHPKFISYVGLIAPKDKVGTYMGYSFLYGVIGSGAGCLIGPAAYEYFITKTDNPAGMWLFFTGIGVLSVTCLLIYNKIANGAKAASSETGKE